MKFEVKLVNPTKTRAIAEARIKIDSIDVSTLCDLLMTNLICASYIPPKEIRNLENIMRQRKAIVKGKTQIKNKIHAVLLMNGIKLPYKTLGKTAMKWIIDEINITTIKTILVSYINLLEQYDFELKKIEDRIDQTAIQNNDAKLLTTIYGIASVRALELVSEIGDIKRFNSSQKLCRYCGLIPSIKQSGSTLRFGRLIKQSNKSLKSALIESSWILIRLHGENPFREFYKKLSKKKGKLSKNQEFLLL